MSACRAWNRDDGMCNVDADDFAGMEEAPATRWTSCTQTATHLVEVRCPQGHHHSWEICGDCAAAMNRQATDAWLAAACPSCRETRCAVFSFIRPLEAAAPAASA